MNKKFAVQAPETERRNAFKLASPGWFLIIMMEITIVIMMMKMTNIQTNILTLWSKALLEPGRPSAGWAQVDRREGTVLMGKFLMPRFEGT